MNKKAILAKFLFKYFGFVSSHFENYQQNQISILAYHRVLDHHDINFPFYRDIISTDPQMFDQQMRFISENYNVITFARLLEYLNQHQEIPRGSVIITFDDGYEDNYRIVMPILKKYGLTATIFITTSFIETGEPFWFELIKYFFDRAEPDNYEIKDIELKIMLNETNREQARKILWNYLRKAENSKRLLIINELKNRIINSVTTEELELIKPLSWDQIREMSIAGIEFGSHTVNHPFLTNLSVSELNQELQGSKTLIEKKINKKVICLAYPFGIYNNLVIENLQKTGYNFGIGYRDNVIKHFDRNIMYQFPRVHVDLDFDFYLFRARLVLPKLFLS